MQRSHPERSAGWTSLSKIIDNLSLIVNRELRNNINTSIIFFDNITNLRQNEGMTSENTPQAILSALKELYDDLYHLNDRYGMCVCVTPRNGQKALQKHPLERSDDYLARLFSVFKRLQGASPNEIQPAVQKVCLETKEKLVEWYRSYHACISSEKYDDDLGIEARRIVLELQAKLELLLPHNVP